MEEQLKQLYNDYMKTKQFNASYYRRMMKIYREYPNDNTELANVFKYVMQRTETTKTCLYSMRIRFIAVMSSIMPLIQNGV
ncbi:MAG: hypothetical protein FWF92_07620 [Oscillospiraceae bacterium]|nr:hypothetical protein [Oscillospiraceae bacterium]